MLGKTAIFAGLLTLGALVVPHMSSAAPLAPVRSTPIVQSGLVLKAQYDDDRPQCRRVCVSHDAYGQCRRWRRVCDNY
jgi:hypothetical protein